MSDQVVEPLFLMHIFGNNYEKETQMQTAVYARKSFNVEAVQVTQENIEEVANWCGGQIKENRDGAPYIKIDVKRALNERQRRAYLATGFCCVRTATRSRSTTTRRSVSASTP